MSIKLIAVDLDGTLFTSDHVVAERTQAALLAAEAAGIMVVPATGRHHASLFGRLGALGYDRYAIANSGALGLRLATDEVLFEDLMEPAVMTDLLGRVIDALPGVAVAALRSGGREFVFGEGYQGLITARESSHLAMSGEVLAWRDLAAVPALKLLARHPELDVEAVREQFVAADNHRCTIVTTGAPFIEVQGPGITKATGLAQLCRVLGVEQGEVMAFGDGMNDLEMLAWAGVGVAMANASDEAKAAADRVTADNDHDGVALVVEELLTSSR